MQRILEPEYMDTPDEAASYEAMDHSVPNAAVVSDFIAAGGARGRVLDLGTGPADIPILLAQRAPAVEHIVAVDAAETMLALARKKVAAAGLTGRISLERVDVKAMPFADCSFDAVYSNTILHHIPQPLDMLTEAWRVLKPGGTLWIRDLYRPDTEEQAWALVDLHASTATAAQRQLLFDSLHAALTVTEAEQLVAAAGMVGASVRMTSDRHYTIVVASKAIL